MSISIFDIAVNISWTKDKRIYLNLKNLKYELLVDYLNAGSIEIIAEEIKILERFQSIRNTQNKDIIEGYIMSELQGFNEYEDGIFAHIAGATDLSTSVHYNIDDDSISLKHPNLSSIKRFVISADTLIILLNQMKKLNELLEF
jgi:hypothetical protein